MFADTFGVSSKTIGDWISTSTGDNSSTTTITLEAVLSATTTITPEAVLIKAKPAKEPHNKCQKNAKNSQQDSLNHLQQLNLIIVVQNIEIETLWNLEQLCKICIESIVNRSQQLKYIV